MCISVAGACLGCAKEQKVAIKSSIASVRASEPAAPGPVKSRAVGTGPVKMYLDGSASMAGYVRCGQAPSEFDIAVDRLTVDLRTSKVYRFGENPGANKEAQAFPAGKTIHCPTFYNLYQNSDFVLFDAIRRDSTATGHVYVTDGVPSDDALNQSPSIAALREWIQDGGSLAIIAGRSHFSGRAWSEQLKQWVGNVSTSQRPFYIFVFSRNEDGLRRILGELSPTLMEHATIMRFGPGTVDCRLVRTGVTIVTSNEATGWAMLSQRSTQDLGARPGPVASYQCEFKGDSPFRTISPEIGDVSFASWDGQKFVAKPGAPPETAVQVQSPVFGAGTSSVEIQARIPADPNSRFGLYIVPVSPGRARLLPRVDSLSTESDASVATIDRTYRFGWLLEQLAKAQVRRQLGSARLSFTAYYR